MSGVNRLLDQWIDIASSETATRITCSMSRCGKLQREVIGSSGTTPKVSPLRQRVRPFRRFETPAPPFHGELNTVVTKPEM